ncbi:MAG: hypothetical protein A2358_00080 [Candidatus Staskawiczbacteria bacterium RIFOXYB1_FULL_37_44]|uniref:Methyltransferase small domain-containing protein n=1 Tax=Candidatus Staskawiczbacteria bacterium RIFOXYB1_FULL_37_44 TaxID=1802223 RepID=A0A1G2IYC9_9BACT|nr:MAG: hypothetical protein A2358_00080 [Candidatus Staskawiczbacteria bacterium RIFOXYB1_FULL_37_44]OGZ90247.1 MAG: hypothetical protein A2581_02460 [Candidatus Staskawiczbacteria bacterium RIFOXYD1_FULL_37_110]
MQKEIGWLLKEKYNGQKNKQFYKDVERLTRAHEPLDYVIGFTEFLGCRINLSKKPLIPRPETEFWVGRAINKIYSDFNDRPNQSIEILDIFAGSGCIGIAVLKHIKNSKVDFADVEDRGVGHKTIISDIFSGLPRRLRAPRNDTGYDYIFANPPYIPEKNINLIQKSVLKFEPKKALFGGSDGLFFIRKFLKDAKNYLNPEGNIFMEFDGSASSPQVSPQKNEIKKLAKKFDYKTCKFYKDQYGKWRWVVIT